MREISQKNCIYIIYCVLNVCRVIGIKLQRSATGVILVLWHVLLRTTCRHIRAGVDTTWYLFAERRGKKNRGERWKKVVKDSTFAVESPRCCRPTSPLHPPSFFPLFIYSRVCLSLLPSLSGAVAYLFLFHTPSHRHLSLASLQLLAGNVSAISPVISWRRVHISRVVSCQIHGKRFSVWR